MLFARGRLDLFTLPAVAIVGSRDHTRYGRDVAKMLGDGVAAAGVVVVSGMARGLDAVAQCAALDRGGTTIGVLGNGIGVVYPAANRELYDRVESNGLLLTENPPGERPTAGSFPRRNRLISGLAVCSSSWRRPKGSGTLVTVAAALEQGREVMAVPGPITSPTSEGTNQLMRDGAEPILQVNDLLAKFSLAVRRAPLNPDPPSRRPAIFRATRRMAFNALTAEPATLTRSRSAPACRSACFSGCCADWNSADWAEQLPGSLFRRMQRQALSARPTCPIPRPYFYHSAVHIYVHVPFCARRCSYCDFAIAVRRETPNQQFVDAIAAEWRGRVSASWDTAAAIDTLYFGGGTPSRLDPGSIAAVIDAGHALTVPLARDAEVTLEANPDDVTAERADAVGGARSQSRSRSACRVTIPACSNGCTARIAPSRCPLRLPLCATAGIDNISIDLIFALPADA